MESLAFTILFLLKFSRNDHVIKSVRKLTIPASYYEIFKVTSYTVEVLSI